MKPVLLDTGVIVSLLDSGERHHRRCVDAVEQLRAPLVTCEAVIAETCYLLRDVRGAPDAVLQNVEQGVFQIPFRLIESTKPVRALLKRYANVPIDLADACLVHLADLVGSGQILTLDEDFAVYRWRRRRGFEFVVSPT